MKETLWQYLTHLGGSFEAQVFYALMLSGVVGMCANWLVRWTKNEVGCFVDYMFINNFKRTPLSILMFTGTALTAVMSGVFNGGTLAFVTADPCANGITPPNTEVFVGWLNVLWIGATTGFGIDATVNKGVREVWTEGERKRRVLG